MSGIAAVLEMDGAPDSAVIERLTAGLRGFGPDRQNIRVCDRVALGHAMLETSLEAKTEQQPFSFDGQCWIVADARLDAREDLRAKLSGAGAVGSEPIPDSALILLAYRKWGQGCVEFLIGDFSFIIWDQTQRILFCARDHFGLRPLYYAGAPRRLLFSSSALSLRREVDGCTIDENALGDFLLFAYNQDESSTSLKPIRRIPPAHAGVVSLDGAVSVRRYWTLPVEEPVRFKHPQEYVDQFSELLHTAVRDRLRSTGSHPVAVLMSGGLDSSAVAASAKLVSGVPLAAFTNSFEQLVRHEEPKCSRVVAEYLHLPHTVIPVDQNPAFYRFDETGFLPVQPINEPFQADTRCFYRQIADRSRVVLTGECGDEVLKSSSIYIPYALRHGRALEFLRDLARNVLQYRQVPRIGIRTCIARALGKETRRVPPAPSWIQAAFAARLDLPGRWREVMLRPYRHPYRPEAYDALFASPWRHCMEQYDPEYSSSPLEFRHPFLDLRLVRYALRLPSFPYCSRKQILRQAGAGKLPQRILARPKTPMLDDPLCASLRRSSLPARLLENTAAGDYVDVVAVRNSLQRLEPERAWVDVRPFALGSWLTLYV